MDQLNPHSAPHTRLIKLLSDRPGHDQRYAIDSHYELGWQPRHTFEKVLESAVRWFLQSIDWCEVVQQGDG